MPVSFETDEIISRLVAWKLVNERAIVEDDLEIRSVAHRNRNLRIDCHSGPSYLVKQPEVESRATLRAEARFYEFCRHEPRLAAIRPWLVPFHGFYPREETLVLEVVDGARSWQDEYREARAPDLPTGSVRALGQALATVHATFRDFDPASDPYLAELASELPRVLRIHRPVPAILRSLNFAKRQLLKIVQADIDIKRGLDAAFAGWRAETVIHGDVRSANVLVVPAAGDVEVRLIDWELVRRGDPAWDLAGGFHDLLLFWLLGMPLEPGFEIGERISEALWPLTAVQTAIRELWQAYAAGLAEKTASELLGRAVGMTGARLIQAAWEHSSEAERLSSLAVLLLQLAANILRDPQSAAGELLGLPLEI